jgi:hypothetical protein
MVTVPGRHRMRSKIRIVGAIAAAMALVLVVAGAWFGFQRLVQPTCSGQIRLTVAAAPEIAPAVQAAATKWVEDGAAVDGVCVAVDVAGTDPADVAANVAGQHGVSLTGVGQASGGVVTPDVWLPDSSTWLLRIRNAGATAFAPTNAASVARSPVVVAMPEPVATKAGWPQKKITWADLLSQITTGTKLRTGIVDPTRDAAGLSGLLALGAAAGAAGADAQKATAGALRALATGRSALRQDLLARFPRSADPGSIASSLNAAALSEEDVIEYNSKKPPIPLAALYLEPAPLSLDYPYAVMPGGEPAKIAAADGLFAVLNTQTFRNRLGAQGLRAADGTWGDGFAAPQGAPTPAGSASPTASSNPGGKAAGGLDPAAIDKALSTWTAVTQPGRMLAVMDVSGSMGSKVPTAGNATRQQVTIAAARGGLGLLDDSWSVGLWTFSTDLVGTRDYKELLPIGPLSSQRNGVEAALRSVVPKQGGGTGLYDTVLAAYRAVQDGWEAGRVNSIVIFTDGENDNASGITRPKLLADLKKLADTDRPIQVIFVGIGPGVSRTEMEAITKVTGGGAFVAADPAKIGDVFLKAISQRPTAVPR